MDDVPDLEKEISFGKAAQLTGQLGDKGRHEWCPVWSRPGLSHRA